jgi:tetratricopeptide (TPR) repeat protein
VRRERTAALLGLGETLDKRGDAAGALAQYRALAQLVTEPAWIYDTHERIGDVLLAQHATRDAIGEYRTAIAAIATAVKEHPTTDRLYALANSHEHLGDALASRERAAAIAEYRVALEAVTQIDASDPDRARGIAELRARIAKLAR